MKKIKIRYCPKCKSNSIEDYAASMTGMYYCRKCGYIGTLIIEKEIKQD